MTSMSSSSSSSFSVDVQEVVGKLSKNFENLENVRTEFVKETKSRLRTKESVLNVAKLVLEAYLAVETQQMVNSGYCRDDEIYQNWKSEETVRGTVFGNVQLFAATKALVESGDVQFERLLPLFDRYGGSQELTPKAEKFGGLFDRIRKLVRGSEIDFKNFQSAVFGATRDDLLGLDDEDIDTLTSTIPKKFNVPITEGWVRQLLRYCRHEKIRKQTYEIFTSRCLDETCTRLVQTILFRHEVAQLTHTSDFLEWMLQHSQKMLGKTDTQMPSSSSRVEGLLELMDVESKLASEKEYTRWLRFSESKPELSTSFLAHDLEFMEHEYYREEGELDDRQVRKYFPIDHVLEQTCFILSDLYKSRNVKFELETLKIWDVACKKITVKDSSDEKCPIIKTIMITSTPTSPLDSPTYFQENQHLEGVYVQSTSAQEVSIIVPNNSSPFRHHLLTVDNMDQLLRFVGEAVTLVLTSSHLSSFPEKSKRATCSDFLDWSVINVDRPLLGSLLVRMITEDPKTLQKFSRHIDTSAPMDLAKVEKLVTLRSHFKAIRFRERIAKAWFDFILLKEGIQMGSRDKIQKMQLEILDKISLRGSDAPQKGGAGAGAKSTPQVVSLKLEFGVADVLNFTKAGRQWCELLCDLRAAGLYARIASTANLSDVSKDFVTLMDRCLLEKSSPDLKQPPPVANDCDFRSSVSIRELLHQRTADAAFCNLSTPYSFAMLVKIYTNGLSAVENKPFLQKFSNNLPEIIGQVDVSEWPTTTRPEAQIEWLRQAILIQSEKCHKFKEALKESINAAKRKKEEEDEEEKDKNNKKTTKATQEKKKGKQHEKEEEKKVTKADSEPKVDPMEQMEDGLVKLKMLKKELARLNEHEADFGVQTLNFMIFCPGQGWGIPDWMKPFEKCIFSAVSIATRESVFRQSSYVYVTIDQRKNNSTVSKPHRRPGWHCSNFSFNTALNARTRTYQCSTAAPERFINKKLLSTEGMLALPSSSSSETETPPPTPPTTPPPTPKMFLETFEKDCSLEEAVTFPANTLLELSPYVVHHTPELSPEQFSTQISITISPTEYNMIGNSINTKYDYSWQWKPRSVEERNPCFNYE